MHRAGYWLFALATCWMTTIGAAMADEAARPTLRLHNGDYAAGRLAASDDPTQIVWQVEGFSKPLHFPLEHVHSLQYPRPVAAAEKVEAYCIELSGGDMLTGQLISLDEREAVLEIPVLGKLHVERSALHRFYRIGAADLIYDGPAGLEGWKTSGPEKAWRDEGGQLRTDTPGAIIHRDDKLPLLVRYEVELAWNDKPNFELSAGLSRHVAGRTAFRLETWGDELVVTRESEKQADVAVLQKIAPGAGVVALSLLFDEASGRLLVYSSAGEPLADLTVPVDEPPTKRAPRPADAFAAPRQAIPRKAEPPSGLVLANRSGTLTLQRLAIRRWSGIAPQPAAAGQAAISLADGETQSAEVHSFDAKTRQLVVVKDGQQQRIDERDLLDIVLSPREEPPPRSVRVLLANGARLSGDLKKIQEEELSLESPFVKQPLTLPVSALRAMVVLAAPAGGDDNPVVPRLELAGVSLRGNLTDARLGDDSCIVFQPRSSTVASPLTADAAGKLIFREAPPPAKSKPQTTDESAIGQIGQVVKGIKSLFKNAAPATLSPKPPGDCLLHLRSGDVVPCTVQFIDERGVTFESAVTEVGFVPHDRIKALELRLDARPVKIEKSRFDRLLTLPRMQRDNPPEQLIRSLSGDYLRGRLLAMNDKELQVEMRLEVKTIDRGQVSRILWLHPDGDAKANVAQPAQTSGQQPPEGIRVQAVPRTGNRLTFFAQESTGQTLSGQSELLGVCHVQLDQVDQLLIGTAIEEAAATLAFHQWKLRPAAEPLPDPEPGDPGSDSGMESVLVGKPAPPIELDLLAGGKFNLADYKDKVVVLDFWASWCGPCLQAMPQVDKVAAEFAEQGVKLVAINLEETPDQVKTALARLELQTAVALDKDGHIAERYGATDIPQTVIIGRDGKVARLFVGGGARFDEHLRQALKAVLGN